MILTIEKLIYGGEGLAHHDGSTVFVPFVLPGEQIDAAPVEQKKKFVRARLSRALTASPDRVAPRCPHFGTCGGCDYQHMPYESQLRYKTEILRETLRRLGRIDWPGEIQVHASPGWAYRNRAQWKVRPLKNTPEDLRNAGNRTSESRSATEGPQLEIGYFRANSTSLCAIEDCTILSPLLLKTLLSLREALAAGVFPRTLREMEAFAGSGDSSLLLTATFAGFPSRASELAEKIRGMIPGMESLLFFDPTRERMELFGPGFLEYETCGLKYRVGHFSFFQVNRFLVDDLAREVSEREQQGRLALDLFAGVGLFSIPLARRFERVVAVESNPAAARDLEANVGSGGRIEVRTADVDRFVERYKEKPSLITLDPPRAGLAPETVKRLVRIAAERITYVSCEPPTLARDLAGLREGGYDIAEVHLFDLFPQTFHMEAVVRLKRHP